jgi:hypothetical protein
MLLSSNWVCCCYYCHFLQVDKLLRAATAAKAAEQAEKANGKVANGSTAAGEREG